MSDVTIHKIKTKDVIEFSDIKDLKAKTKKISDALKKRNEGVKEWLIENHVPFSTRGYTVLVDIYELGAAGLTIEDYKNAKQKSYERCVKHLKFLKFKEDYGG